MTLFPTDYTCFYRWEWFRKPAWQQQFRVQKRISSSAFIQWARKHGLAGEPVLDSSCGLGLKTLVMREAGLCVHGSDTCAPAVELARKLAGEEGQADINYFVSSWADLPSQAPVRYRAVINDVLAWVYSEEEMAASLRGFHDVLAPGGALVYMGATPESRGDPNCLLEEQWQKALAGPGPSRVGWHWENDGVSVTMMILNQKGEDYLDEHLLYLIEGPGGSRRTEGMTVRRTFKWQWPKMEAFLREAGFVAFRADEFTAENGQVFSVTVAERE